MTEFVKFFEVVYLKMYDNMNYILVTSGNAINYYVTVLGVNFLSISFMQLFVKLFEMKSTLCWQTNDPFGSSF